MNDRIENVMLHLLLLKIIIHENLYNIFLTPCSEFVIKTRMNQIEDFDQSEAFITYRTTWLCKAIAAINLTNQRLALITGLKTSIETVISR